MSAYLGFLMKDMVVLAIDRRVFNENNNFFYDQIKLTRLKNDCYGVGVGLKNFIEPWLQNFSLISFSDIRKNAKLTGSCINKTYLFQKKMMLICRQKINTLSSFTLAGFSDGRPSIITFNAKNNFAPVLHETGYVYGHYDNNEGKTDIDFFIVRVMKNFSGLLDRSIEERKTFLLNNIAEILYRLSQKYKFISAEGDIVFITRNGASCEEIKNRGQANVHRI